MAIDPSIPLAVKPAEPVSSFLTMQRLAQQHQLGQVQVEQAHQAQHERGALRELLRRSQGADLESPAGRQAFVGELGGVAPEKALALRQQFAQEDVQRAKLKLDTQKAQLRTHKDTMRLLGELMYGVKDQSTWDRALQIAEPLLRKHGFGLEGMPRQYDPAVVGELSQMNRTSQQRVEEALKRLEMDR